MAAKHLSNKYEQRAYIKICTLLDEKPLSLLHGDALSYPTVKEWADRVKECRHGIEDQPRSGRLISSCTPEIITQVQALIGIDPHLTVEEIGIILDISSGAFTLFCTILWTIERFHPARSQNYSQKNKKRRGFHAHKNCYENTTIVIPDVYMKL